MNSSSEMIGSLRAQSVGRLLQVARILGIVVCVAGVLVLVGWSIGAPVLKSMFPGGPPMAPMTAVGFILAGISVCVSMSMPTRRWVGHLLGGIIATIGLFRLAAVLGGFHTGMDRLLFSDQLAAGGFPGNGTLNSGVCFIIYGLCLLTIDIDRFRIGRPAQLIALPGLFIASTATLGYLYRTTHFLHGGVYTPMPFNTAICFMLLGAAIICSRPDSRFTSLLMSETMGGRIARRLMLPAVFIPPVIGWLRLYGDRLGIYDDDFRVAMLVFTSVAVLLGLLLWNASLFRDVEEERKRAQDALQLSETRWRLAVAGSNDGLWEWDLMSGELYVASRYRELLGYNPQEGSMPFGKFAMAKKNIHPDDFDRVIGAIEDHVQNDAPFEIEMRQRTRSGEYRWYRARGEANRDERGYALRMAGSMTDITDLKLAEEAALQAKAEAEKANRAKSEFLSRMSHELRTPLNAVLGFAQLIELNATEHEDGSNVEQIMKAGKHLLGLIDEILDISRIEAGKLVFSMEQVSVGEIMEEVIQLMSQLAAQRSIQIIAKRDEAWDSYILVDRQRMKQVLVNLVSNAVKYNVKGGTVTLCCAQNGRDSMHITVKDTGLGISECMQARLFTPFDRLDAERTGVEGTGLGLALSKRLVELMGGEIGVESEVGKGSTFYVDVVLGEQPAAAAECETVERQLQEPGLTPENRTVLYIEDNKPNLELVEAIFKDRHEINLLSAMEGRTGVELAREHLPDLILLDMNLPDIQGRQVLSTLQSDPRTTAIPVVIVSADAVSGHAQHLLDAGAKAYLTKPISVRQFLSVVDDLLYAA